MDATNNRNPFKTDSAVFTPLDISDEKDSLPLTESETLRDIRTRTENVALPGINVTSTPQPANMDYHAKAVALLEVMETLSKTHTNTLLTPVHFNHLPIHLLIQFLIIETFLEIMTYIPQNTSQESLAAFQELKQFLDSPKSPLSFFMKLHNQFNVPKGLFIPLIRRLRCLDDLSQLTDLQLFTKSDLKGDNIKATNTEIAEMFRSIIKLRLKITRTQTLVIKFIKSSFEELDKNYKKLQKDMPFIKNSGILNKSDQKMRILDFYTEFFNKYRPFLSFINTRLSQNLIRQSVLENQASFKLFEMDNFIHETTLIFKLGAQILSSFDLTLDNVRVKDEQEKVANKEYRDKVSSLIANFYPQIFKQIIQHIESYTPEKRILIEECSLKTLMEFLQKLLIVKMKTKSLDKTLEYNRFLFKEVNKIFPDYAQSLLEFSFTSLHLTVDNLIKEIRIRPQHATLTPMGEHPLFKCLQGFLVLKNEAKINRESLDKGLSEIEKQNDKYIKEIEDQTEELFEENHSINNARVNLKTFQATLAITNQSLIPLFTYCRGILTKDYYSEQAIDALWMDSIDTEVQQRPKTSVEKKRILAPKKSAPKKIEKIKGLNTRKNNPLSRTDSVIANPLTLFSLFKSFLCDAFAVFPSDVVDQNPVAGAKLYDLDQAYHVAHLNMALEMLTDSANEESAPLLPLLIANFNYHLYMSQEQALTPLYLAINPDGELIHDLSSMAKTIGTKTLPDRYSKGSFWYRYPNQNKHHRTIHHIPTTLDLNLKYEQETLPTELHHHLKTFRDISKEGIKFFFHFTEDYCADQYEKPKFEKLHLELENSLDRLEKCQKPQPIQNKLKTDSLEELDSQLSRLYTVIKSIEDKVRNYESNKKPENQIETLKDLLIHVKRIEKSLYLLKRFPLQRHLSVHAHNFVFFGQYMIELAGAFESLIKGENFRDHDLTAYQELLNWNKWLKIEQQIFIADINVKKGSEYIHWEFFKCKGIVPKGLKLLSETYRLSINASEVGEGFLPKDINEDLEAYHDKLTSLSRNEVSFLEQYYANVLKDL